MTTKMCNAKFYFVRTFLFIVSNRLIVTDYAQCGAWQTWAASNKRIRNARISRSENPSNSGAVQFFFHILSSDPYNEFNMQEQLFVHFQEIISTPEKPFS